jgi:uncharacterized YigZ family protein
MARYPVPALQADDPHCTQLVVRKSRFLAQCAHAQGPDAARTFVDAVRRRHPDATHNCWAFVAGPPGDGSAAGYSDDGEPHGTAGRPMLQVLLHGGIGEIAVVVSRWFGGTKLGTGGLARAYQDAVQTNLASLAVREKVDMLRMDAIIDYADVDGLHRLLPAHEARIVASRCLDRMTVTLEMPLPQADLFKAALAGATNGRGRIDAPETGAESQGK